MYLVNFRLKCQFFKKSKLVVGIKFGTKYREHIYVGSFSEAKKH